MDQERRVSLAGVLLPREDVVGVSPFTRTPKKLHLVLLFISSRLITQRMRLPLTDM